MNGIKSTEEVTVRASHLNNKKECTMQEISKQPENLTTENFTLHQRHIMNIISELTFDNELIGWPKWKLHLLSSFPRDIESGFANANGGTSNVHHTNKFGDTDLHQAVALACLFGDIFDDFYSCIELLMSQQIQMNKPNKEGYTEIGSALRHRHKKCVEHMLQHTSAGRLHLDYFPEDSQSTEREIIKENCPELQPLLPASLMERHNSS